MSTKKQFAVAAIAAVAILGWAASASAATTIYLDGFTTPGSNKGGPYTSSLALTAPDIRLAPYDTATWLTDAETGGWGQTGSGFATPSSSNFLPFTPQQGYTYTLTATMDWTSDPVGDQWMVLAFTDFSNHNWNGAGNFLTAAGAQSLPESALVRPGDATQTYTITLDTTAPGWINTQGYGYVGWIMNGASANNIGASRIQNFTLTSQAIPEPSTLVLVGFGLLGTIAMGRRFRRTV